MSSASAWTWSTHSALTRPTCTRSSPTCVGRASRPWRWNRPASTGFRCSSCWKRKGSRLSWSNPANCAPAAPGPKPTFSIANGFSGCTRTGCCGVRSVLPSRCRRCAYHRQRQMLIRYAAGHVQHTQKALTQMNVKLTEVLSDITGRSGLAIIDAILGGERCPDLLAGLASPKCARRKPNSLGPSRGSGSRNTSSNWNKREHYFATTKAKSTSAISGLHSSWQTCPIGQATGKCRPRPASAVARRMTCVLRRPAHCSRPWGST